MARIGFNQHFYAKSVICATSASLRCIMRANPFAGLIADRAGNLIGPQEYPRLKLFLGRAAAFPDHLFEPFPLVRAHFDNIALLAHLRLRRFERAMILSKLVSAGV